MAKDPAMPFYVNDWLSSPRVACMTLAQQGAFVRLLCYCWSSQDAAIPDDDKLLSVMSGMGEDWFTFGSSLVRDCFEPHPKQPSMLTNKKLLSLWQEIVEWKQKSADAGRKSGEARRKSSANNKNGHEQTFANGSQMVRTKHEPNTNSSSLSSSSSSIKEIPPNPQCGNSDYSDLKLPSHNAFDPSLKRRKPDGTLAGLTVLVNEWNLSEGVVRVATGLKGLTSGRQKMYAARMKSPTWIEDFRAALEKFPLPCFENSNGWKPTFEWFMRPDTVIKIIEGTYDWEKSEIQNGRKPAENDPPRGRVCTKEELKDITAADLR